MINLTFGQKLSKLERFNSKIPAKVFSTVLFQRPEDVNNFSNLPNHTLPL